MSVGPAGLALTIYIRTLEPTVPTGDGGELITAAWLLGVPHPPGYPLFTLLGHLAALLPLGSPAYGVNLMSALFHSASVALVGLITYRLVEQVWERRAPRWIAVIAAIIAGLALAFSTAFWAYAVVAEVFALNSFFAALILWLLLEWSGQPHRWPLLWTSGLASGLALTNQQTIVLLAPACLILLVSGARQLPAGPPGATARARSLSRNLVIAAGFFAVGLLPYVYLPLAAGSDPALNWGDPRTLPAFMRHVLRSDYGTVHLTVAGASGSPLEHVRLMLNYLAAAFTLPGCALAIAGWCVLWIRRRTLGLALLSAFVFSGPLFLAYADPPIDSPILYGILQRFYILPSAVIAAAFGLGAASVVFLLANAPISRRVSLAAGLATVLLALPAASLVLHFAENDQSANTLERDFGLDLLAPLEAHALFIVQGDATTIALDYAQLVSHERPDVLTLNMEKLKLGTYVRQMRRQHPDLNVPFEAYQPGSDFMARLVEANWNARPVYILGSPPEQRFDGRFDKLRAGFAVKLVPKGSAPDPYALDASVLALLEHARYPSQTYPDTTFESGIVQSYGGLAFDVAYVLDDGVRGAQAIDFYRRAIAFNPVDAPAYKNLGRLLFATGAPPPEVGAVWQQYLRLAPADPEAPAIRARLHQLGAA